MISKLRLLFLFLLIQSSLLAQDKYLKKGDRAINKGDYVEAILQYKKVQNKTAKLNRKIAESYFTLGDYKMAESFYDLIPEGERESEDLLSLAKIHLAKDNFEAAILIYERAKESGADLNEVERNLKAIDELIAFRNASKELQLIKINAQPKGKCLGISSFANGIVYSNTSKGMLKKGNAHQLVVSAYENAVYESAKAFAKSLEAKTNIGAACLSPDGLRLYYTRWFTRKGKQQMEIAVAEIKDGKWQAKESLGFCSRKYSCCYPFLSSDGRKMYFASDMKGGFGGMDLYVSEFDNGNWTTPKNLGSTINTFQNEIYPRIVKNDQLWFSSDGHGGYGALDLFFTEKYPNGTWAPVKNPGMPYNSEFSDYSILDFKDREHLLFVSDRADRGLRDQIYKLEMNTKDDVEFRVKDSQSGKVIDDLNVQVRKVFGDTEFPVEFLLNQAGYYQFSILKDEKRSGVLFEIVLSKENYQDKLIEYNPSQEKEKIEIEMKPIVRKSGFSFVEDLLPIAYPNKKISFQNIYYQKNEAEFSEKAKGILDRLYRFWKAFPEVKIKINVHSDAIGDEQSNMEVSVEQAKKAKRYLAEKGLESSVVEVDAWGEQFILNACFDLADCSEEEHQENRRLELLIVLE
ncbi:OmpA family protein [Labilibaculum sp. DW002]|uniref:OmpA family protein n=1 Tax=Paralabilibaculum antarcticum TaxID=2912572 RepID=A0ABT5VSG2_9BACT|nr:OmpA family protein [Labilibaculum sp. DW002]MDE5417239.1 OmpA family protein [Labilibaculum sp. DW002]